MGALGVVKSTANQLVELKLTDPVVAGRAISVSYGVKANAPMLLHYGFSMPWVGALTCLARARLTLEAPGIPDLVLWPTRCFQSDTDVETALRALRWRELGAAGLQSTDGARAECAAFKQPRYTPWHGCRSNPPPQVELAAWGALASAAGNAQQRLETASAKLSGLDVSKASSVLAARPHALQLLTDELAVLKALGAMASEVRQQCGKMDDDDVAGCLAQVRDAQALGAQWGDAIFEGLMDD